jgi:hypothetical protein
VDYGLARRATLASVFSGRTTVTDVCDAHPYLLRAAKFHGEPTGDRCPICRKTNLTHVTYVYGDELGQYEGRVKQARELSELRVEPPRFLLRSRHWRTCRTPEAACADQPVNTRSRR